MGNREWRMETSPVHVDNWADLIALFVGGNARKQLQSPTRTVDP